MTPSAEVSVGSFGESAVIPGQGDHDAAVRAVTRSPRPMSPLLARQQLRHQLCRRLPSSRRATIWRCRIVFTARLSFEPADGRSPGRSGSNIRQPSRANAGRLSMPHPCCTHRRRRAARTDRVPSAPSTRPPHHGRAHFGEQEHHDRPAGGDGQARVQWGRAEPVVHERRVGESDRQDHCLRLMTGLGSWPPKRSDLSGVVRALIEMIRGAVGPPSDRSGGGRQHAGKG